MLHQNTIGIRESQEEFEEKFLSPLAARGACSKGREADEEPCPIRTAFQRDRDRIIHCKAFRRLKHKTQVFISPIGDHYRTRLTHTLEVSQVSRTIARALRLNEDLTESICMGHDLGHPPFGHVGEGVLSDLYPKGFWHNLQSVRVARLIERLNLSHEVLDGIAKHTGGPSPETLEGQIVKTADRIAYLHHDVEDAVRAGLMREEDLPPEVRSGLGPDREARLRRMVTDMVETSRRNFEEGRHAIAMSEEVTQAMYALRNWMFKNVYLAGNHKSEAARVRRVISSLYEYFNEHPDEISPNIPSDPEDPSVERRVVDYIAGMTDRFAIDVYTKLFLPTAHRPQPQELPH